MFAENLNTRLLAALERPDLSVVAVRQRIVLDATLDGAFRVDPDGPVVLGAACLNEERHCAFHIRHALELSMLLDAAARPTAAPGPVAAIDLPVLAGLAAARVAARFWLLDEAPDGEPAPEPASWIAAMADDRVPDPAMLALVWSRVRHLQGASMRSAARRPGPDPAGVPAPVRNALAACWPLLGPAETLMAEGGDARLRVDPRTGLNHYGCSHRPRPWAVTFASSTASSLSERGFGGAEAARKRLAVAALHGRAVGEAEAMVERVRLAIAAHYGLDQGTGIVLTASGTDGEMAALAVCALPDAAGGGRGPISNVLLAPEETGAGVPLAAAGRHFATDTARGLPVRRGERIAGFPDDTRVLPVAIRDPAGRLLAPDQVDRDCAALVAAEAAEGRLVLLHRLDLSKTGMLAPGLGCMEALQERWGDRLEVVVDACQARLDRHRVQDYVRRGWMVMVTGSKFFTGPPFCGALLLPERLAARLGGPNRLPQGLRDYAGRGDWPAAAMPSGSGDAGAAAPVNLGMALRWEAALAEMAAFAAVPAAVAARRTACFIDGVERLIAASPHVAAVGVPDPARTPLDASPAPSPAPSSAGPVGDAQPDWDRLQTIRSFLVLEPGGRGLPLGMARARQVYRWLNADVSRALPAGAGEADRSLARLLCHIGQPAPVADHRLPDDKAGALRISVGARLLSGEPSHAGLDDSARLKREINDVRRILDKIGLLLAHWPAIERLDPEPRFASDVPLRRRADPGLNI